MRFLYVAPRYHTNQMDIMKGLKEQGHEVCFISHYRAVIEDYSCVEPIVLGYSWLYRFFDFVYVRIIHRNDPSANVLKIKCGIPPILKLWKAINAFQPDVVIVRERSMYSMLVYMFCVKRGYPCILYNQSPYLSGPVKKDLPHRLANRCMPKMRMTPVYGIPEEGVSAKENDFFIPFVANPQLAPKQRTYFEGDRINILCVGKYEERKHHLMLAAVAEQLSAAYPLHLTLIGEATTRFQKEYHAKVVDYVKEHHLEDIITIKTNVPRKNMDAEYATADVYVIPSTKEPATVSQLEAMSFSLPVICSDANGAACYVEDGVTGYQFRDCDSEDLQKKLELLLADRQKIREMGAAGYRAAAEKYTFQRYYDGIMEILEKIRND